MPQLHAQVYVGITSGAQRIRTNEPVFVKPVCFSKQTECTNSTTGL